MLPIRTHFLRRASKVINASNTFSSLTRYQYQQATARSPSRRKRGNKGAADVQSSTSLQRNNALAAEEEFAWNQREWKPLSISNLPAIELPQPKETIIPHTGFSKYIDDIHTETFDFAQVLPGKEKIFLTMLSQNQWYDVLRRYLKSINKQLSPPCVLQVLRALADAKLVFKSKEEDRMLVEQLRRRHDISKWPASIRGNVAAWFEVLASPAEAIEKLKSTSSYYSSSEPEVLTTLACHVLDLDDFELFREICAKSGLNVCYDSRVLVRLVSMVKKNKAMSDRISEWYLEALSGLKQPITRANLNVPFRFLNDVGVTMIKRNLNEKGQIDDSNLQLRVADDISEEQFQELKIRYMQFLNSLTSVEGSLSQSEITRLTDLISSWKKELKGSSSICERRMIVIDTLNVTHGLDFEHTVKKMINEISSQFKNILLISRNHQKKKVSRFKWPQNVKIFYCNDLSEDDLFVLLAALEWGLDASYLSNDLFTKHVNNVCKTDEQKNIMLQWMDRRAVRIDDANNSYKMPSLYSKVVQRAERINPSSASPKAKEVYYVPVFCEASGRVINFFSG